MATIKSVAKKAGVSISTASYALNGVPKVKAETKARVLAAAEELGYYPNANARNLKTNKTGNVGVFIYGFGGPVFSDILEGINDELHLKGYNIIVSSGASSNVILRERQVDAAVIFDDKIDDKVVLAYAQKSPVVVLDRRLKGDNIYQSLLDNEKLVYRLIKKVIQKGYRKLCYLSGPEDSFNQKERYIGFERALAESSIEKHCYIHGDFTIAGGYRIGKILAKSMDKPDFVFCANDELAIGLIQALNETHIKIPAQIAVAGFDGIYLNDFISPKLTTININHHEWGKQIVDFLINVLEKKPTKKLTHPEAVITFKESC